MIENSSSINLAFNDHSFGDILLSLTTSNEIARSFLVIDGVRTFIFTNRTSIVSIEKIALF